MMDETLFKSEEKAVFSLRKLYKKYGYLPFKMSKFEEYDLYVKNKDFLISDRVITFNDTNGKLMALKPDVTLSIIKNGEDIAGYKQKVYYNENVYRVSESTHQYKEIMQTGLECVGDIDDYDIFETVYLAALSLSLICEEFVLDVSHLGILTALLDEISFDEDFRREIANCVAQKNAHDLERICKKYGIEKEQTDNLCSFVGIYGDMGEVIHKLEPICKSESAKAALEQLKTLYILIKDTPVYEKINLDFSIVNDMNYYNGIVFKGFLNGICEGVLAGGQYDKLLHRMGRKSGAVGFALYLDLLENLENRKSEYDVDVLILYNDNTSIKKLAQKTSELIKSGNSVSSQKADTKKVRYRRVIDLREEERA